MTSASALFYPRRSRFGRSTTDLEFDSSSDTNSNLNDINNRRHHHNHHHRHHDRHNSDVCESFRRSPHVRRQSQVERESFRHSQVTSQSEPVNSRSTETLSSRANRLRLTRNERLPGTVLLARERLLERLRGLSLSTNRRSSRSSSGNEFNTSDDFRLVDAGDWETEISREWLSGGVPFTESTSPFPESISLTDQIPSIKKPPGLTQEALDCLRLEIFEGVEGVGSGASQECTVCLEGYLEGDKLIHLACGHKFHDACLSPWVRTCGDCPNCRTYVVVSCHRA